MSRPEPGPRRRPAARRKPSPEEWRPLWSLRPKDDPELERAMGVIGRAFGFTVQARLEPNDAAGGDSGTDAAGETLAAPLAAGAENLTLPLNGERGIE